MCKFCEDVEDSLITKEVNVLNKKILFDVYLNEKALVFCVGGEYMRPLAKKNIKYCPMCGRKLNE